MASGLLALLDDIAGIAKLAAASLDDVGAAAGKASSKAAGVVIDDAAVTPGYVIGFTPDRELPIIARIAKGSLINKLLFLLPLALLLSAFAPWAVTPLLMIGGTYLAYEGAEKLLESFTPHAHHEQTAATESATVQEIEDEKVRGAIRTDFILSGEIMAISLATVTTRPIWEQASALLIVAVLITGGVYGAVGLIVKMDDIGLHMAKRQSRLANLIGRALVQGMPILLRALSGIGTFAMLWVGGGILIHGLDHYRWTPLPTLIHHLSHNVAAPTGASAPVIAWAIEAGAAAMFAILIGLVIVGLQGLLAKLSRLRHVAMEG